MDRSEALALFYLYGWEFYVAGAPYMNGFTGHVWG
jgi:hypothetical protein